MAEAGGLNQTTVSKEGALELAPRQAIALTVIGTIVGIVLFVGGLGALLYSYWSAEGFDPNTKSFWLGVAGIVLGLAGFVVLLNVNQKYAQRDPLIRQALTLYNFVLIVCFLAGILIVFNLLIAQYGYLVGLKTFDWTSEGVYTLHDQTINQLKAIDKPLKIYILYPPGQKRDQIEQLVQLYRAENPQLVDYEIVNYWEDRLNAQKFLRKYPELEGQLPALLVVYGEGEQERHKVIRDSELFTIEASLDPTMTTFTGTETTFNGENALTSAIRELREAKRTKVYFTVGHGELDTEDSDPRSDRGIGYIVDELRNQAVDVGTVNLLQKEVPDDADVVVVAGPRTAFDPEEIRRLRDYLDRRDSKGRPAGRLLVLVDSPVEFRRGVPADLGLNSLLKEYRVELGNNLVVDRTAAVGSLLNIVVLVPTLREAHAVLKPLAAEQILFSAAREVKALETGSDEQGESTAKLKAQTILSTVGKDPYAWAEGNYDTNLVAPGGPEDTPGPVSLAVVVEQESDQGTTPPGHPPVGQNRRIPRMVVVGDSTFAANVLASANSTNMFFFINTVHWLAGRIEDVGIPPKTRKSIRLILDHSSYITLIFEPGFAILGGIGVLAGMVWVVRTGRYNRAWLPLALVLLFWCSLYALLTVIAIEDPETRKETVLRVAGFCVLVWLVALAFAGFAYLKGRRELGYAS